MNEKKKHKIMLGIEVILLCMIVAILGTNAASSNPPSNGISYGKNNQTTVEGALNDLYTKANYGNASASQILKDKTALVGGSKVTGTMPSKNGSSQASEVSTNANNVYMVFPYGYYPAENHFSTANSSEVYATNADVASAIGLTAGKLLKGQTVLGITGTGTTGVDTNDATATAADISSGKTAYVKGQKITGTGISGKTYELKREKATVSGQTFNYGTWTRLTQSGDGKTADFSVTLPFTPTKLVGCHLVLSGNYATSSSSKWDANFREGDESFMMNLASGTYASTSADSLSNYTDTETSCTLSGNKLNFHVYTFCSGSSACNCRFRTRANEFYLTGIIVYE